jgi:4-amino-4-deoxy-L-arabinose transferase-like glycosyltransferase
MHPPLRLPLIPPGPVGGVVLLLGAAAALRLGLLHTPLLWPDESVVATMGLEVLRGGLPVYYHGQPFMGALHAYLAAPLYVLLGPSAFAIELLSVLVTVAWLLVMARLAWVTFGPRVSPSRMSRSAPAASRCAFSTPSRSLPSAFSADACGSSGGNR